VQAPAAGPTVRVLTYNVNWGGVRPDLAVAAIREADADVVCLQETTPEWETYLRGELADGYPHVMFRHSGGAGGLAFLSRHRLDDVEYVETPGWFPGWLVRAETPIGAVQFMAVHLRPPLGENGSVSVSGYVRSRDVRVREVQTLHGRLDSLAPAVILGDFNENASGEAFWWLIDRGFADAVAPFDAQAYTWEWRTSLVTLRNRFDHVLVSPHLRCVDARVMRAGASDHFPVIAVLGRSAAAP
jgi:endonuclease/exonuclease/phosphatase family metal-dependent hydrolase